MAFMFILVEVLMELLLYTQRQDNARKGNVSFELLVSYIVRHVQLD